MKVFTSIRYGLLGTVVMVFLLGGRAYASALPPIEQIVQKLQGSYERTEDLSADFVHETTVKSIKQTQKEQGRFFFKNPNNVLWDYSKPSGKKLIVNSEKAWLYLQEEKVVYTKKSNSIFESQLLINFFSGTGKLNNDFLIDYDKSGAVDATGNYRLFFTPREKVSVFSGLKLVIDKETFYILQLSFNDAFGNTTRLGFYNIRLNTGLKENLFRFKPPAGVQIFEVP